MRPVEDFMREFLRARIIEEQRYQANRAPYRRKFFHDDCVYDSHAHTLSRMESEEVESVDTKESDAHVVTTQTVCYSGGTKTMRLRYHLQPQNDNWLIREVQTACFVCDGLGDENCPNCKGKQWLSAERGRGRS